jgi:hypothetical protein
MKTVHEAPEGRHVYSLRRHYLTKLRRSGMLMSPLTGLGVKYEGRGYKHAAPPGLTAYCLLPTAVL